MLGLPTEPVHLWTIRTSDASDFHLFDGCRKLLSNHELRRANQFVFEKDRIQYVLGHALVRVMLSAFSAIGPREWQFAENAYGKPRVADGFPPLRFNLTHTKGLVACIVSPNFDVGIDAEWIGKSLELDVARNYFAMSEVKYLESAPQEQVHEMFFDIWTLKESYIKARGQGLSIPLNSFAINPSGGSDPTISFASECADDHGMWRFFRVRPGQYYRLAVCVHCSPNWCGQLLSRQLTLAAIFEETAQDTRTKCDVESIGWPANRVE
jgi:4'-phosphopantetheinyl transferase